MAVGSLRLQLEQKDLIYNDLQRECSQLKVIEPLHVVSCRRACKKLECLHPKLPDSSNNAQNSRCG